MNVCTERLLQETSINNFAKSWIIFSIYGLEDPAMRVQLETGFQPWKCSDSEFQYCKLNFTYCQKDHLPQSESDFEWEQFMDFRHATTFLLEDLELICSHHQPSNICFYARSDTTARKVGDSIDGL